MESKLQQSFRRLNSDMPVEDLMLEILQIYMDLFPVSNSHLLRYSPLGHLVEGIISLDSSSGLEHIRSFREDARTFPAVYSAIRQQKAIFVSKQEYLKGGNLKYNDNETYSMLVVPLYSRTNTIGLIFSNKFIDHTEFNEESLSILTQFGQLAGSLFETTNLTEKAAVISKRELEVMRKIAVGEIINEVADSMNISEETVKQYVKSVMKKLNAQNRVHAVAELIRMKII